MNWEENWPMGLMLVSVLLFVGALFAVFRFLRHAADPQDVLDWPADQGLEQSDSQRRPSGEGFITVGLLVFVVLMTAGSVAFAHGPARDRQLPPDGVLWTPEALLRDFFPSSERVVYRQVSLTPEEQTQLAALTRAERESDTQLLYVAETGERIDGYAFLTKANSGDDAATFGVQLDAGGRVKRVEVMRLLEREQQEVLDPRFVHQFEGRRFADAPRLHRRVDAPLKCTSACTAATRTVRRALFLVSRTRSDSGVEAASPAPSKRR